jgi:hypothetical protein
MAVFVRVTLRRIMISSLGAGALLLAACSNSTTKGTGSGGSSAASSAAASSAPASAASSPAPSPSAPSTSAASAADEKARIAGIPIQAGELPGSWKATPPDNSTAAEDAAQQAELVRCVGTTDTSADRLARVEKDWTQGDDDITSNAQAMKSDADLRADVALLKSPKINSCYEQTARKTIAASLPSGATVESLKVTITPGSAGGPGNLVAVGHGVVTVRASGQTVTIYEDLDFIAGKRIEAEIDFTGVNHHIDPALQKKVVAAVARRAADA